MLPRAIPTATLEPTSTPKPTKEPPKTGPLATIAALSAQVTIVPATPIGGFDASGLTDDDYVGITKQAWYIIESNYVRDNFNGVDWDAVYDAICCFGRRYNFLRGAMGFTRRFTT